MHAPTADLFHQRTPHSTALRTAFTLRRDAGLKFVGAPVQRLDGGLLQTSGPRDLVADHNRVLTEALGEYDRMASRIADREEWVITHGEPKANNIMITSNGPVMIDWDTVRLAPPARDLWMTGGHQRYTELTGRQLSPQQRELAPVRLPGRAQESDQLGHDHFRRWAVILTCEHAALGYAS